ncbi:MAG TPA: hypothetical protein VJN44_01435, partial [Roseateles sp.]|nr:hypothetical protein [Roseateles sp.]
LPLPEGWALEGLCRPAADGSHAELLGLLRQCSEQAQALSVTLDRRLFSHVGNADRLVWQ